MGEPQVGVIMGSRSDWETMKHCCDTLEELDVRYETRVDPGFPMPGMLRRQAQKQIVKGALQDLKKRVEG